MKVHNDDERLDLYVQSLAWRLQTCGCPYRDTLRMCRAFRSLGPEKKAWVFKYGLTVSGSKKLCMRKPPVMYCQWQLGGKGEDEVPGDEPADECPKPQ